MNLDFLPLNLLEWPCLKVFNAVISEDKGCQCGYRLCRYEAKNYSAALSVADRARP